jgi:hypothetical protein
MNILDKELAMRPSLKRLLLRLISVGCLVSVMNACDEGDTSSPQRFVGVYEANSYQLSGERCETLMSVDDISACSDCALESAYFKIEAQSFFGQRYYTLKGCSSLEACEVESEPEGFSFGGVGFDTVTESGLTGRAESAAYGGASCSYNQAQYELSESSEGVSLSITNLTLREGSPLFMLSGDECLDLTDQSPSDDELSCRKQHMIQAQKL